MSLTKVGWPCWAVSAYQFEKSRDSTSLVLGGPLGCRGHLAQE